MIVPLLVVEQSTICLDICLSKSYGSDQQKNSGFGHGHLKTHYPFILRYKDQEESICVWVMQV